MVDIRDFNTQISATAPTAMETRVCREVGVRAHAPCGIHERELWVRDALGPECAAPTGDMLQRPARRLEDFGVALRDRDEHVELL